MAELPSTNFSEMLNPSRKLVLGSLSAKALATAEMRSYNLCRPRWTSGDSVSYELIE